MFPPLQHHSRIIHTIRTPYDPIQLLISKTDNNRQNENSLKTVKKKNPGIWPPHHYHHHHGTTHSDEKTCFFCCRVFDFHPRLGGGGVVRACPFIRQWDADDALMMITIAEIFFWCVHVLHA